MIDIFISSFHSAAFELAEFLQSEGLSVWWDTDLHGGMNFRLAHRKINEARVAIVVWTVESVRNPSVIEQAMQAQASRKLLALRTPDVEMDDIPAPFSAMDTPLVTNREAILKSLERLGFAERRHLTASSREFKRPAPSISKASKAERDAWESAKASADPEGFEQFLNQFPESNATQLARKRLQELRSEQVVSVAYSKAPLRREEGLASIHDIRPANDPVEFGVSHALAATHGVPFVVDAWVFPQGRRKDAVQRAMQQASGNPEFRSGGAALVTRGTQLSVKIKIETWEVSPPIQTLSWTGAMASVSFAITPLGNFLGNKATGRCIFLMNGLRIAEVVFQVSLSPVHEGKSQFVQANAIKLAFASYASKDRRRVLARVQGMEMLGVNVFVDVRNLNSNESYPNNLLERIESSDALYLFWSRHAKDSIWVDKEWRHGLNRKGIDFINPVPLVDPRKVRPPDELAELKHFDNWVLAFLEYEKAASLRDRVRAWLAGD